jgi:hypothetical protein
MALKLKIGTVQSKADISQTGMFKVAFKSSLDGKPVYENVKYVTPYGNTQEGFVAVPPAGSQVLVAYEDNVALEGDELRGNFYLGSVMGAITGLNKEASLDTEGLEVAANTFLDKSTKGLKGPTTKDGEVAEITPPDYGTWPERFKDMYDGKGITPEAIGITNHRGDAFKVASRYNNSEKADLPFQDYRIGIMSGGGKRIEAVDSPIVDGIVMTNEHRGKDFFIWSTGLSEQSPFAEGEYHMRTHGPVNMYTLMNRFHIWVEEGLNVEIENKATGKNAYGPDTGTNSDGRLDPNTGEPANGLGDPGTGGYFATRAGVFGNETTGCIQLLSHHNNISLKAEGQDSVVFVNTPGPHSRVIVESGGSVDIVARGKITLQSETEVEITAPQVDINGSELVHMNGKEVQIKGNPNIHLNQTTGYDAPAP